MHLAVQFAADFYVMKMRDLRSPQEAASNAGGLVSTRPVCGAPSGTRTFSRGTVASYEVGPKLPGERLRELITQIRRECDISWPGVRRRDGLCPPLGPPE